MKFTYHYQVKWHDTDVNRHVTPSNLLAYMQETSNYHLISAGMSLDRLRDEKGLAFLLSRIAMRMYEPLFAGDEIDVETWVCESRGLSFNRCFRILRGECVIAEAFTVWALLDLRSHRLLPSAEFPYDIEPEAALSKELQGRVRLPAIDKMQKVGERKIVYSDIDYNGHMNNTHYPNMLCDFTPAICKHRVAGMTMSFLHEAAYGHTLCVYRGEQENGYQFRTVNEEGTTCLEATLVLEPIESLCEVSKT